MEDNVAQYSFVKRKKCCEDITRYTQNVIRQNGYHSYRVELCTDDGYYVTIFRIQRAGNLNQEERKPSVLIVHGLAQSMADFVMEKQQLGYFLVDSGFDVWIANCRGTTFSRKHRIFPENSKEYWNYSFHEIGLFDLPKFIDFILEKTQNSKLHFIGFSQGCTAMSILLSTKAEYNDKIEVACFLCPPMKFRYTEMSLMKMFFVYICPLLKWITDYLYVPLHGDFLTYSSRVIGHEVSKYQLSRSVYELVWNHIAGYKGGESVKSMNLEKMSRTSPNTVSLKQLLHFSQIIRENKFSMYDYGSQKNMELYGKKSPPSYDLSKISVPVSLFYSRNDTCYGVQDVKDLSDEFGNCVYKYIVEDDTFNHFDFTYHKDVVNLLYRHVLNFLKRYPQDRQMKS